MRLELLLVLSFDSVMTIARFLANQSLVGLNE